VRHRERIDLQPPDLERRVGIEALHPNPVELDPHGRPCTGRDIDRNAHPCCETSDAADVIVVLVRDEHGIDVFGGKSEPGETLDRLLECEAAIQHHARIPPLDDQRVAAAAASERCKSHRGGQTGHRRATGKQVRFRAGDAWVSGKHRVI